MSSNDLLIGKVIKGHYQVVSLIGEGGVSRVYKGRHLLLNREVALKYILPRFIEDDRAVMRLQQEAQAAASLRHPNICSVSEFGTDDEGTPFLVMDYVDGKSLSAFLKERGKVNSIQAMEIITQVCRGLAYAHGKGVIHRDLKPGNIMLSADLQSEECVKIIDFGIAKIWRIDSDNKPNLTKTGDVIGTPNYMSPEQSLGKKVDSRTDIYSLGCMLYELLTGEVPFRRESALEVLMCHVSEEAPLLPDGHPGGLREIVERCLYKDPQDRYQSVGELLTDLDDVRSGRKSRFEGVKPKSKAKSANKVPLAPWYANPWKLSGFVLGCIVVLGFVLNMAAGYAFRQAWLDRNLPDYMKQAEELKKETDKLHQQTLKRLREQSELR